MPVITLDGLPLVHVRLPYAQPMPDELLTRVIDLLVQRRAEDS